MVSGVAPGNVHAALILAQLSFGGGAIVGKFGVHGTNPVLFAFIREAVAGPILCAFAYLRTGRALPGQADWARVCLAGVAIFANQLCFIVGLKLADPVAASAWQPTQPLMTLSLAVFLGLEVLTWRKGTGIVLAVLGALTLVLGKAAQAHGNSSSLSLAGHCSFFFNCLGTSVYVLTSKSLLMRGYDSSSVTGWSYMVGSACMLVALLYINTSPASLRFVCASEKPDVVELCVEGAWAVPITMFWPLMYWIFVASICAYFVMTWANKYAKASTVSAYTVLQPVASGTLSALLYILFGSEWAKTYGFQLPGSSDLGVLGIIGGLGLLFSEPQMATQELKEWLSPNTARGGSSTLGREEQELFQVGSDESECIESTLGGPKV